MKLIGSHNSIIRYFELGEKNEKIISSETDYKFITYLALEYAANNSLQNYLSSREELLDEKWVRYWFRQIV